MTEPLAAARPHGCIFYSPFADYLRTVRYATARHAEPLAGVYVGGCVERGAGSSFRKMAHAHIAGKWKGWICVRSAKRLYTSNGEASTLMRHELAHILTGQGHTDAWRKCVRLLGGKVNSWEKKRSRRSA